MIASLKAIGIWPCARGVWESDIMIEGEAHCLYKDQSGNVFDITPRVSGEEKILFIEDSRLNVSLRHIKGTHFSMIQHTNPQLIFSLDLLSFDDNDCNLNIPRYIDNSEAEDLQSIEAHLKGGIPTADVDINSLSFFSTLFRDSTSFFVVSSLLEIKSFL